MRRRTLISLLVVVAIVAALGAALYLQAKSPPEAARLLPESDAIVYFNLKTLRTLTHFDQTPVKRSSDFQQFIDATGIVPERDIDSAAFALQRMANPNGPNGKVAYSEVFIGTFDGTRLGKYLESISNRQETYAGRTIYCIPIEGRTLRVVQLGYDTVAASNTPSAEQIHSMIDRQRASAISTPGSSLLAARYGKVPLLSQAWGIGHIGLPFAKDGRISVMGLELPLAEDTDLVASLRYSGSVHLRIEEIVPDASVAQHTVETLTTLLNILRSIGSAQPAHNAAGEAMRSVLDSVTLEQHKDSAVLNATASLDQVRALASASTSGAEGGADGGATKDTLPSDATTPQTPAATPQPLKPSKP